MLFFGKKAVREANELGEEADKLKKANFKKMDKTEASTGRLYELLKANGISLRIHIATGGDHRHG